MPFHFSTDRALERRLNAKKRVRVADDVPQGRPKPPSDIERLKDALDKAHQENCLLKEQVNNMSHHALSFDNLLIENKDSKQQIAELEEQIQHLKNGFENAHKEKSLLIEQIHSMSLHASSLNKLLGEKETDKEEISRLEQLLQTRESQFEAEDKKSQETITKYKEEISHVKNSFQIQIEQLEIQQHLNKKEYIDLAARFEADKKQHAEQNAKAVSESQNSIMLQNELQNKLKQRDDEVLNLKKDNDKLSQRLTEATNHLWSNGQEFLQSDKAWQTKYQALQEKFRQDLAEKEQSWETRVQQVEEEKNELELCLKEEKSRRFWSRRDNTKTGQTKVEEKTSEEDEMKKKEKEERVEMKNKEKEEKTEMKKKEKEEKREMKKKEKEEKAEMKKKEKEEKVEMKKKEKEEKVEMKKKEKEEKREVKNKEKEEKAEMKKKEKEEKTEMKNEEKEVKTEMKKMEKKGFMSWMHKKKKCDSDSEVEEAAGCSSQVGQQQLPQPPP